MNSDRGVWVSLFILPRSEHINPVGRLSGIVNQGGVIATKSACPRWPSPNQLFLSSSLRPLPPSPLGKSPLCLETLPQKRHRVLTSGDVLGPRTGATVLSSAGVMAPLLPGGPRPVPWRSLPAPTTPPQRPFRVGEGIEPRWRMTATPRGVWECWGYLQSPLPLPAAPPSSPRVLFPPSSIYVPGSAFFNLNLFWRCGSVENPFAASSSPRVFSVFPPIPHFPPLANRLLKVVFESISKYYQGAEYDAAIRSSLYKQL